MWAACYWTHACWMWWLQPSPVLEVIWIPVCPPSLWACSQLYLSPGPGLLFRSSHETHFTLSFFHTCALSDIAFYLHLNCVWSYRGWKLGLSYPIYSISVCIWALHLALCNLVLSLFYVSLMSLCPLWAWVTVVLPDVLSVDCHLSRIILTEITDPASV